MEASADEQPRLVLLVRSITDSRGDRVFRFVAIAMARRESGGPQDYLTRAALAPVHLTCVSAWSASVSAPSRDRMTATRCP
jgi:hypothetical protein